MSPSYDELRQLMASFSHDGFTLSLRDPDPQAADLIAGDIELGGEPVGWFERRVIERPGEEPDIINQHLELLGDAQGRGFGRAFVRWSESVYRDLGFHHVEVTPGRVGSYAWAREGYDFDLPRYGQAVAEIGEQTDDQRRAAAVLTLMDYEGHLIERSSWSGERREASPRSILASTAQGGELQQLAAESFASKLPTGERISSSELADSFLCPRQIAEFDDDGRFRELRLARRILRSTWWYGRKDLR